MDINITEKENDITAANISFLIIDRTPINKKMTALKRSFD
jgi:hypothetical protein